jgi:hypothetical protein
MRLEAGLTGAVMLALAGLALQARAQSNAPPPDRYGDRQQGYFGDPGQGYFGNPADGNFTRHHFSRDQEGRIAPSPAVPLRRGASRPAAEVSPYLVLPQPAEEPGSR